MLEYEVIRLGPAPDDAAKALNELASMDWRVVAAYSGDRIILQREKPVLIGPKRRDNVREIRMPIPA